MRQAMPSRMRIAAAGKGMPGCLTLSRAGVPARQSCRDSFTAAPGLPRPLLARAASTAAGVCSHLASISLQVSQPPHAAAALAAEPVRAKPAQVHLSSSPAAAPGNGAHAGEEQAAPAAANQQHVVVNFYHLTDIADPEQVCRAHKAALKGLDIRGRIYISAQGINAQYSGPAHDACQYARWVEGQPQFQALRWTQAPVDGQMFPRLRLQVRSSLVSLAGGTASLPITDPAARATPLAPSQWRAMLRDAVPLLGATIGRSLGKRAVSAVGVADDCDAGGTSSSAAASVAAGETTSPLQRVSAGSGVDESRRPGYSGRPPLSPDGAPASTAGASGYSWRSLGHGDFSNGATGGVSVVRGSRGVDAQPSNASDASGSAAGELAACGDGVARRRGVVVLDVRNGYEWDAGHFVGAERPAEDAFRETPTEATGVAIPAALAGVPADTPVMMYCTGGIRCDIYSTHLRKQGFTNLYTLEGGVHNYLHKEGGDLWNGSLFVFDGRMAVPAPGAEAEERPLVPAVSCQLCGGPATLPHRNCANLDCNRLFVACDDCTASMRSCCCEDCISAPRLLRPVKQGGYYLDAAAYAVGREGQASIALGRGEGRKVRRRRWQQRLHERKARRRECVDQVRAEAKKLIAEKLHAAEKQRKQLEHEGNCANERLQRLQELRTRFAKPTAREAACLS